MNYTYAEIKSTSNRWYIEFYCIHPLKGIKTRKRIYIRNYKTEGLRIRHAKKLQEWVNRKLDNGWNPFVLQMESHKHYEPLYRALDFVLSIRSKECEPTSMQNYRSRITHLKNWLNQKKLQDLLCYEFTPDIALNFMNDTLLYKEIGNRTYNSYLIDFKGFCNTLLRNRYLLINPFKDISKKKPRSKTKMPWSMERQQKYLEYVKEHDFDFYITSMYCYYFAIRPKELCLLKVSNVNFEAGLIHIPEEISKNDRSRSIPIPDQFYPILENYLHGLPDHFYLCSKACKPGKIKIAPTRISERFRAIANHLNFGPEIQFYGLKDTSAEMLIRAGVHPITIQLLFDHTSLKTTDAYMSRITAPQLEQLRYQFPNFGGK